MVKLHDHINDLQQRLERDGRPDGETHPSISSYDPNNPNALQRKIGNLKKLLVIRLKYVIDHLAHLWFQLYKNHEGFILVKHMSKLSLKIFC